MDSVNNMHASNTKIKIVKRRSDKKTVLNSALVFVCFEIFWDMCKARMQLSEEIAECSSHVN